MTTCTFDVLNAAGASFTVSNTVLDADGNAFVVGIAANDADGNSFDVGTCTGAVTPPVSVGVGGKQSRSRSKRERILVYDEVEEEVEEILAEVDKVIRKEPKKKADTPAIKPDDPVSVETVFDWIGYYEAMIARLRDRQRAQALQTRLMVASQMMLAAMQKAEAERLAYEAFLLDEEEVAILLAA